MKCTHCGNTNLVKTDFNLGLEASIPYGTDVYFCVECGHYEFFSSKKVESYKNALAWIHSRELEIEQLNKELEELPDQDIQREINMLESQLKSLDITIRQQQEFTNRVHELKRKLSNLSVEIKEKKKRIGFLQREIETRKHDLECGRFYYKEI